MSDLLPAFLYFLGASAVAFILMGVDKQKAKKGQWRIPERTLWTLALIGGALGGWIGMRVFRHKTKHRSFIIGMPLLIIVNIATFIWLMRLS